MKTLYNKHLENRRSLFLHLILTLSAVLLTGCANGYRDFYTANVTENHAELELLKPGQQPVIYESSNFEPDVDKLVSKNFRVIGSSSFNGKMHSKEQLLEQAISVRSTHVIYGSKFVTNQITSTPIFTPNGFGGINSTAVTGQHMRYDQGAVYLAKSKHKLRFGIFLGDLTPELRKALGTNKGARIANVMEDTPAFEANLFKDDVITRIDNKEIINAESLSEFLGAIPLAQDIVTLSILRDGKPMDILLRMKN